MKQRTRTVDLPNCTLLLMEIPEGAYSIEVGSRYRNLIAPFNCLNYSFQNEAGWTDGFFELPSEGFGLLGLHPLTEEQAGKIIESDIIPVGDIECTLYKDYLKYHKIINGRLTPGLFLAQFFCAVADVFQCLFDFFFV